MTVQELENTAVAESAPKHHHVTLAGMVGNVMEWYDFAVYGYFAPIIAQLFFPSTDPVASLISAFGVFAVGYVMRPVGGAIFGHIGDRHGRRAALLYSVVLMAIPTFLLGLLPTHAQIGAWAPVLLVLMRLLQGTAVGGEYTSSVVFLVEQGDQKRRGLVGSWSVFGAVAGILLGSAVGALLTGVISAADLHAWGWRIPFIIGLLVGLVGLLIRQSSFKEEPPELAADTDDSNPPIIEAFRTEWKAILQVMCFCLFNAVGFYTLFVYVTTYFEKIDHMSMQSALDINTLSMVALLVVLPLAGWLSDKIGRKPVLLASTVCGAIFAYPLFQLMSHDNPFTAQMGQFGFSIIMGLFLGVNPVVLVEMFPRKVRCSAVSIGYNLCLGLFGGTSPIVATWLINYTKDSVSPAYYVAAIAVVSMITILTMRETYKEALT